MIDDDPAVRESTVFLLAALGFEPRPFADARAFLAALAELPPACILTDLRMPGVDGWELAAALRARKPGWPMLLMTSDSAPGLAERAAALGFAALLDKPLDAARLAQALDQAFARFPA